MDFKAAMFDFDGTVTNKGSVHPSKEMAEVLRDVASKMPLGFCTGRHLESFEERGLEVLVEGMNKEEMSDFLRNVYLILENGAIGYIYNGDGFEEFYRVKWPVEFIGREELIEILNDRVKEFGEITHFGHRVPIVLSTKAHTGWADALNIEEVYRLSGEMYKIVIQVLSEIDADFEKYVHVGNSGIGVLVGPADGDKDRGIIELGKKIGVPEPYREILVVGDRPDEGGNDFYFLEGKYGTPWTVGEIGKNAKSVVDSGGERLLHDKGLIFLLKSLDL